MTIPSPFKIGPWKENPCSTDQEKLYFLKRAVRNHLKKIEFVNCYSLWVSYYLTEQNMFDQILACDSLPK